MLYDDREVRPGVKFADADLVGMPVQIIVGAKGVANGIVERKHRATGDRDEIPLDRGRRDAQRERGTPPMTLPLHPPLDPMLAKFDA